MARRARAVKVMGRRERTCAERCDGVVAAARTLHRQPRCPCPSGISVFGGPPTEYSGAPPPSIEHGVSAGGDSPELACSESHRSLHASSSGQPGDATSWILPLSSTPPFSIPSTWKERCESCRGCLSSQASMHQRKRLTGPSHAGNSVSAGASETGHYAAGVLSPLLLRKQEALWKKWRR